MIIFKLLVFVISGLKMPLLRRLSSKKKLALNYYQKYLHEAGDTAENAQFANERIRLIRSKKK